MTIAGRASRLIITCPSGNLNQLRLAVAGEDDRGEQVVLNLTDLLERPARLEPDGDTIYIGVYLHAAAVVLAGRPTPTLNADDLDVDRAIDLLLGDDGAV